MMIKSSALTILFTVITLSSSQATFQEDAPKHEYLPDDIGFACDLSGRENHLAMHNLVDAARRCRDGKTILFINLSKSKHIMPIHLAHYAGYPDPVIGLKPYSYTLTPRTMFDPSRKSNIPAPRYDTDPSAFIWVLCDKTDTTFPCAITGSITLEAFIKCASCGYYGPTNLDYNVISFIRYNAAKKNVADDEDEAAPDDLLLDTKEKKDDPRKKRCGCIIS